MSNGPRYDHAAAAAARIVSLRLGSSEPGAEEFGKILFMVLDAMYAADRELNSGRINVIGEFCDARYTGKT